MLKKNEQTTACVNQERRRHKRFQLGVPVVVSWQDAQQVQHEGAGLTRDVSVNGGSWIGAGPCEPTGCGAADNGGGAGSV